MSSIDVIFSVSNNKRLPILSLNSRRRAYYQYRTFIWEITRYINAESLALSIVGFDSPFDPCVSCRGRIKPGHVLQFAIKSIFLGSESCPLQWTPAHCQPSTSSVKSSGQTTPKRYKICCNTFPRKDPQPISSFLTMFTLFLGNKLTFRPSKKQKNKKK